LWVRMSNLVLMSSLTVLCHSYKIDLPRISFGLGRERRGTSHKPPTNHIIVAGGPMSPDRLEFYRPILSKSSQLFSPFK